MSVRLFVGNLPYGATEQEIREYFGAVAEPTQIIMPVDRETGRPRGFAFVEYAERGHAEEAISRFNAQSFKGRPLAVSEARPREERSGPRPPGSRPAGPRPPRSFDAPPAGAPKSRREGGGHGRRGKGRGQWAEDKPKRPIQVRTTGRIYDVEGEDGDDDLDIDNFATSLKDDDAADQDASANPGADEAADSETADDETTGDSATDDTADDETAKE